MIILLNTSSFVCVSSTTTTRVGVTFTIDNLVVKNDNVHAACERLIFHDADATIITASSLSQGDNSTATTAWDGTRAVKLC